jgi:hypothetical protein
MERDTTVLEARWGDCPNQWSDDDDEEEEEEEEEDILSYVESFLYLRSREPIFVRTRQRINPNIQYRQNRTSR